MISANVAEICGKLQTNERRPKIGALEDLMKICGDRRTMGDNEVLAIFDECYLHLLKCYSDRYESVREQAVQTVNQFIERLPPSDFHLLNIVATLAERMGQQETLEESEEIRLLYVQQLHLLGRHYVTSGNVRSLQECYSDIVRILVKALRDSYPTVQREACACVVLLAQSADTFVFQQWTIPLAKALYGMLNHKHSQARIAAVAALGYVALHTDASGDALSQLLMEVSPLLMDSMPLVRRECGELGIRLLLELRDRYSYFERIIPLVLCCLKDDSPEVREYILPKWVKCGQQYYEENEAELSKQEIGDLPAANYPKDVERPTIGCRGMVQRALRLLKLITRESADWKENVRLHSLKLLYQFVLHAEAAMTAKFFEIYPDVARACSDTEAAVVTEALKVSDLMGRLLSYEDWCEHAFDGLSRNAKEGYLKCFYHMFSAATGVKFVDVLRLSRMLVQPEFSQSLKAGFQLYVLKLVETSLEKTKEQCEENTEELEEQLETLHMNSYVITIKVMALSVDSEQSNICNELQQLGNSILEEIAVRSHLRLALLHERHFKAALSYVENIDAPLDELSEPIILLYGLLKLCKFREPYLADLQDKINIVFAHCADEAKVKIFSAVSIAMLDWSETVDRAEEESIRLLKDFVANVVEKHLLWRAGANAEAMRSLATATLCSLSQGAPSEARFVLPDMAKYMPSLLEDNAISTRHYAVKCMYNFGELKVEDLKPIAYAVLQRLDDPSADIRVLAVRAIPKLCPKFVEENGADDKGSNVHDHSVWEAFVKRTFDMFFLHYDGPEVRLQAAIKDAVLQLAKQYPEICEESYKRTISSAYNCWNLMELQTELPLSD